MCRIFGSIGRFIISCIDFFYAPFSRWFSLQMFRYAATGVGNMMLDWVLYFFVYNFILQHNMLHLGFVTLSSHIASLIVVFPITLITGFFLAKYVTFTESKLGGRTQLLRYISVVVANLLLNYLGLKLLVDICHIYPTPSKMIVTIFCVALSYLSQKHYSFR